MKEYVEKAAIHELVKRIPKYEMFNYDRTEALLGINPDDVDFGVDKIPAADVVSVVRCRECIHRDGTPGQPNILCGQMHDDDFCSYGQRKEDEHETN